MRALLLAAGYGQRLKPITNRTPKCLIKINGKPILKLWLDKLEKTKINEVFINTHYLENKVIKYLNTIKSDLNINLIHEEKLLGTGGTLLNNIDKFFDSDLLFLHADNYWEGNLNYLLRKHKSRPKKCLLTMLTFKSQNPEDCGILKVNQMGIMTNYIEKPKKFIGSNANAAVICISKKALKEINKKFVDANDFCKEIIPNFVNRTFTYRTTKVFADIGTKTVLSSLKNQL